MSKTRRGLPALLFGNVLVVGDTIVDVYHSGSPLGVSSETPTLVVQHEETHISQGGAAFLVRNMLALGGNVTFITLVGADKNAAYVEQFTHKNLTLIALEDASRPTTVKERFWSGDHKLLAWDHVDNTPLSATLGKAMLSHVQKHVEKSERLVISDYRHGLLTDETIKELLAIAKKANKKVYVDSQVAQRNSNHISYKGADLFCLNEKESKAVDENFTDTEKSLRMLQKKLGAKCVILKRGEKGSAALLAGSYVETPGYKVKVEDTIGAGDAFFAVLALAEKVGEEELVAANKWAALKCALLGTQTPNIRDL